MNTRVSIIVPVYDVENYIEQCLRSVMSQTYTNIECIIVDDCGSDRSMEICEQMVLNYNGHVFFKFVHHDHNRGLSEARNSGTAAATGDWIYYLDSDDYLFPDSIEKLVNRLEEYPDCDYVQGGMRCSRKQRDFEYPVLSNKKYLDGDRDAAFYYFQGQLPVQAWNRLLRRSFIEENHLDFKPNQIYEDELWSFRLAKAARRVGLVADRTYHYRNDNPTSIINRNSNLRRKAEIGKILRDIVDELPERHARLAVLYYTRMMLKFYGFVRPDDENFEYAYSRLHEHLHQSGYHRLARILNLYRRLPPYTPIRDAIWAYMKTLKHHETKKYK